MNILNKPFTESTVKKKLFHINNYFINKFTYKIGKKVMLNLIVTLRLNIRLFIQSF